MVQYIYIYVYIWYMVNSIWYINVRMLQNIISGIPLIVGFRIRIQDPGLDVVFWAPITMASPRSWPRVEPLLDHVYSALALALASATVDDVNPALPYIPW